MAESTVKIINELGLHARPAAEFVKISSRFRSNIFVSKNENEVNGKSIMSVMTLAAEKGSELRIRAVGKDADEAVKALVELINNKFHED
jgi:phosphocarrier protein